MQFLKINYSLNKIYFVEDQVIQKSIKKILKKYSKINLQSCFSEIKENEKIYIKLEIDHSTIENYANIFTSITDEINENLEMLINRKADNIQIITRSSNE